MEKFVVVNFEDLYHLKNCVHYVMTISGREDLEPLYNRLCAVCANYEDDVPISLIYPEAVKKIIAELQAEEGVGTIST